jgi:hypothetical protein
MGSPAPISYLYAAFSLKQRPVERGLTIDQAHQAKFWASQIFFVASQEMLHLAQAWNLLSAIGGTPYCLRPNLPQSSRYYPLHARIALEPFGEKALRRFIVYESPTRAATPWVRRRAALSAAEIGRGHVTIGQLYETIAEGFCILGDGVFVGAPANQVDRRSVQFSDLVTVRDTASAIQGIEMITHQGEGTQIDRLDCHYGIFMGILKDFRTGLAAGGAAFQPTRPVIENPVASPTLGYGAAAHPIRDPLTRQVAELFDAVYFLMLQALAFAFTPAMDVAASARGAGAAIELMTTVVRPVGDALTTLPAGGGDRTAGPAFGLTRFVPWPADPGLAVALLRQRLDELAAEADRLAASLPVAPQLEIAAARLHDAARRCSP